MTIVYNLPEHVDAEPFGSVIDSESMRRAFWSLSRGIKIRDHLCVLLKALQLALAQENQEKHDTSEDVYTWFLGSTQPANTSLLPATTPK